MKPETGGNGFNPEAQSNRYAQIPDLVRKSILARPKDARRAQTALLGMVANDQYFDPVIIAIAEAQRILLVAKNQQQLKSSSDLLQSVIFEGYGKDSPRQKLLIRATPEVIKASDKMMQNDEAIKKKPLLRRFRPPKYETLMSQFSTYRDALHEDSRAKGETIRIGFTRLPADIVDPSRTIQEAVRFNQWNASFDEASNSSKEDPGKRDQLIDLLKTEPDFSLREKLFTRKCAQLSLQDIEAMEYPLSEENFTKITNFLIEILSDNESTTNTADKHLINTLFLNSTFFIHKFKPIVYRNKNILGNINSYQELFVNYLLFSESEARDAQLKELLQHLPSTGPYSVVSLLVTSVSPDIDPDTDISAGGNNLNTNVSRHPILYKAMNGFVENHEKETLPPMIYLDEIGHEYFYAIVFPLFKQRLIELGVDEKFKRDLNALEELPKDRYAEYHLSAIKTLFEENCGEEFLETLSAHTEEIQEITQSVWQDALERMHYLPMQEGGNIIEFSKESVPSLLNISSIQMIRDHSQKDWNIYVLFRFQDISGFSLMGFLTPEGKLELKAPLDKEIPGLYTMFNHIAVLTFHDLVVQERKEREAGTREPKSERIGKPENGNKAKGDTPDRTYSRDLPRVQTDQALIKDVYVATGREPRRVELHKSPLGRRKNYLDAVVLYQHTVNQENVSQDEIKAAEEILEEARHRMYKISEQKKLSSPAKFSLETIQDPASKEQLYLETWVVEHTSPKPTAEELASPLQLFKRYYRGSSALASSDQMKPWFIGQ